MIEFKAEATELKKAVNLANSASGSMEGTVYSHCLFDLDTNQLKIYATDKNSSMARAIIPVTSSDKGQFTADPKVILKLIRESDIDTISFQFDPDTYTLKMYCSDNPDSFVSLPSYKFDEFPSITETFEKAYEMKTLNAGVFLYGLKYTQNFLSTNSKDVKFGNVFISNGIMYGTNGSNKASAFHSPELSDLNELIFPGSIIGPVSNMINQTDPKNISIKTTSNNILVYTEDENFCFGFTKVQIKIPRIPIDVKAPETNAWRLSKNVLSKKIKRLCIAGDTDMGIKGSFEKKTLFLTTTMDRASKDSMVCEKIREVDDMESFLLEARTFQNTLDSFGDEFDFYLGKRITFYSNAQLSITEDEKETMKPIICTALLTQAQLG